MHFLEIPLRTLLESKTEHNEIITVTKLESWLHYYHNDIYKFYKEHVITNLYSERYKFQKWNIKKGEALITGKWPTRFVRAWKDVTKLKPTKEIKDTAAQLGVILCESNHLGPRYFEIADSIEWNAGDFGDEGSCWFRRGHESYKFRQTFEASKKGYAIKLYRNKESYNKDRNKGIGRAWLALHENYIYLWNARGIDTAEKLAAMLAEFLEVSYTSSYFIISSTYTDHRTNFIIGIEPFPKDPILVF